MILKTICLGLALSFALTAQGEEATVVDQAAPKARLPLEELRIFAEAFDRISKAYVEEVDDKTLLENAIQGLLDQLDPHSAFLDADAFEDLQESTTGNYGGLGMYRGGRDQSRVSHR